MNVTFPDEGQTLEGHALACGTASDDHGVQYVFVRVDDGPWQLATGMTSWTWTDSQSTPAGRHTLYVRAYDGRYYSATAVVNFTLEGVPVPDQPPRLHLLSPMDGDAVQGSTRVIARAEDENSTLVYELGLDDATLLEFTDVLVWDRTLDLTGVAEGPHRVWVRAFDGAQWSATVVAVVNVTILPEPDQRPIVSIARPTDMEVVFGNVTISGTVFDDHSVEFVVLEVDGRELAVVPDAWKWSLVWDSRTVADGYHNITGWAWDGVQRSGDTTIKVLVRQPENYFRRVGLVIIQPLPGQQVSGVIDIRVDVTSEPAGFFPERLWLRVDDLTPVVVNATGDLVLRFDTGLVGNGWHTFHVRMTGHGLQSDEAEVRVTVLNTVDWPNDPPTLAVEFPWDGAVIQGEAELRGTAFDDHGLLTVEMRVDDGPWTRAEGGTRWSFQWDSATVSEGAHRFAFRSFDGDKYSDAVLVEVVVDNVRESPGPGGPSPIVILLVVLLLALAIVAAYIWLRQRSGR